ncbi:MAG: hypothetical protein R3C44_15060 [Chloroflexota bacterium]
MPNRNDLLDFLDHHYNLEEFKTLCFRLGVDYDDLPGETLLGKMRELVAYMERHRRLPDLQRRLERDHPDAYNDELGPLPAADARLDAGQSREIQALAQALGRELGRESGRFLYQAAYAELNRTFEVRSFRDIPATSFEDARQFLERRLREAKES